MVEIRRICGSTWIECERFLWSVHESNNSILCVCEVYLFCNLFKWINWHEFTWTITFEPIIMGALQCAPTQNTQSISISIFSNMITLSSFPQFNFHSEIFARFIHISMWNFRFSVDSSIRFRFTTHNKLFIAHTCYMKKEWSNRKK